MVTWIASSVFYTYDYSLGLSLLFFLSFSHVLLEFPLNIVSIVGIGTESLSIFKNGFKKPSKSWFFTFTLSPMLKFSFFFVAVFSTSFSLRNWWAPHQMAATRFLLRGLLILPNFPWIAPLSQLRTTTTKHCANPETPKPQPISGHLFTDVTTGTVQFTTIGHSLKFLKPTRTFQKLPPFAPS